MKSSRFSLQPQSITYTGGSMKPTFRDGDGLTVEPYGCGPGRVGDVIVFYHPENDQIVIHRIVSVRKDTIRTRGDHNIQLDPWILEPGEIIGKVVFALRGNRRIRVWNGPAGHIHSLACSFCRKMDDLVSSILHPSYRWLSRNGVIRKLFGRNFNLRILSLQRPEGVEFQLFFRNRPIGRRRPETPNWEIKRPYRLLIDESTLP